MLAKSNPISARAASAWFALALASFAWIGISEPSEKGGEIKRIQFARGASSAQVRGAVVRGERALYSIEAGQGQHMSLRIVATENNAVVQVYAPGAKRELRNSILYISGDTLPGAGEGDDAAQWAGTLPGPGVYLLVVGSTRGNATYRLTVTIR
jgi:hypothetical protein